MPRRSPQVAICAIAVAAGFVLPAFSQNKKQNFITGPIDDTKMFTARGNVRPEVKPQNDRGPRIDSAPVAGIQLVLRRSADNEAAFQSYLASLNDPQSGNFHKWLTNAQVGAQFGPSDSDVTRVSQWLTDKGFAVQGISPDRTTIAFDGNVGLVRSAFHTSIHNLSVNGQAHFANTTNPEFPAALAPVVSGVASLNDFRPHTMSRKKMDAGERTDGMNGSTYNYVGAADLATIYNFNPTYAKGVTGKGVTIALIEDTDLYSTGDWQVFRKAFGLTRAYPYGTLTQVHPTGTNGCAAPGVNGDDGEAAIDVEWASAAAPNATILNAACADTDVQFGGFLALQNLLQSATPPKVISISYGDPETDLGAADNAYISNLYSTAAAEGVSVYVSSGDSGSASYDQGYKSATHGIQVSGFTSTPYNISVGGTDFGYKPLHIAGTYFNGSNLTNFRTALSYVPEIPWDNSCASQVVATYTGRPQVGATSYCNAVGSLLSTAAGSGGPSNCALGESLTGSTVTAGCVGYPKPSWQSLVGVPSDGVRDTPDVSLFAANGLWGSYYAVCLSDPAQGESACGANPATWAGYGGTSISSPIWAGIQALVNESTGQSWGNSNPLLYQFARAAYGSAGSTSCNSSLGSGVASNCVFYDVTQGDNTVDCTGSIDCYIVSGTTYGAISTSTSSFQSAFPSTVGYDFTSGIGTTNVGNLVTTWTQYALRQ